MSPSNVHHGEEKAAVGGMRILQAAVFTSNFDRFAIGPLLVSISHGFDAPLSHAAGIASVYYLLFGATQIVWGTLSDRLGRVRVMRLTLLGAAVAGVLSTLAPSLWSLLLARAFTGSFFGAINPTSMVYVGDAVPIQRRQRAVAEIMAATSLGTAVATVGAGLAAQFVSWRLAFAAPALAALGLSFALARLPETVTVRKESALRKIRRILQCRWALLIVILGVLEGGAIFGGLTYLAPALESQGQPATVAGFATAVYGLATVVSTGALKRIGSRLQPPPLIAIGAALIAGGYLVATAAGEITGIVVASALIGSGFAFLHSTLLTWATDIVPEARGTTVALFTTGVFGGSAIATASAATLVAGHSFGLIFTLAAVVAVPLGVLGTLSRLRYGRSTVGDSRKFRKDHRSREIGGI
jgi:predicted MFS family arabinose efflux permease